MSYVPQERVVCLSRLVEQVELQMYHDPMCISDEFRAE